MAYSETNRKNLLRGRMYEGGGIELEKNININLFS